MKNRMQRNRSRVARWMLGATVAWVLPLFSAPAIAGGRCLTVEVPGSFVLPNGQVHAPGSLRLCDSLRVSPVTGLHKTYVGGHLTGMLESRVGRSEGPAEREPYVQFRRNARQQLELIGYAWPDGKNMKTFSLVRDLPRGSRPAGAAVAVAAETSIGGPEKLNEEPIILVAVAN